MNQFMVEVKLPEALTQEFLLLIPTQREFIDEKFNEGIISGYTLAMDRSKLWVTFIAKNVREVREVMDAFPIADYIDYNVHELAFNNSVSSIIPEISLN
jgi:hypothetical protein